MRRLGAKVSRQLLALRALEHSQTAYQHTGEAHADTVNGHGIAMCGHADIAALAHKRWEAQGCPEGSAEEDWLQAAQELRARPGVPQK